MKFVNLTPHAIVLNDGVSYPPSGTVCRVGSTHTPFDAEGVCEVRFGEVENLPASCPDTMYIVSGMVAAAVAATGRTDVVSPATGHPAAVRQGGQIVSVPGFVRAR